MKNMEKVQAGTIIFRLKSELLVTCGFLLGLGGTVFAITGMDTVGSVRNKIDSYYSITLIQFVIILWVVTFISFLIGLYLWTSERKEEKRPITCPFCGSNTLHIQQNKKNALYTCKCEKKFVLPNYAPLQEMRQEERRRKKTVTIQGELHRIGSILEQMQKGMKS